MIDDHVLSDEAVIPSPDRELLLRDTKWEELERICRMEQGHARRFINPYSLEQHEAEFAKPTVLYKSIWHAGDLLGFLILSLDADERSVEFRRIVISKPGRGYGTKAVRMVDQICRGELGRSRVWLDVFETNELARHVYERCGFRPFGKSTHQGRSLCLYEKVLGILTSPGNRPQLSG